jgi:hypothetical protein
LHPSDVVGQVKNISDDGSIFSQAEIQNHMKSFNLRIVATIAFSGVLSVVGAVQDAHATNYFNWGVEGSKVNYGSTQGQYDVVYFGSTIRDCTVSHAGSCSIKLSVIGNDGGNQQMGVDLLQWNPNYPFNMVSGSALYYRWWMKVQAGFNWGTNQRKTKSSRVITANGHGGYTGYVGGDGFWLGEAEEGAPGTDPVSFIAYSTPADSTWHEYIVMVKPNTTASSTDARFELWVDGKLIGQQVNNFRLSQDSGWMTDAWGGWMVAPYFQLNSATGGGTIYLDDFSTDDSWNSLIGVGVPVTLPPPTNLQVQ